jgi:tetratricopeptide (TPR) repeat protein
MRWLTQSLSLLLCAFGLAGCGATSGVESSAPQAVASVPARSQASPARTFPLGDDRSRSSLPSAGGVRTTSSDGSASEPELPPEALREFESAVAMVGAGNVAAAEHAFAALAAKYPLYAGPLVNLGILQSKAGRYEDAEKSLRAALERKPDHAAAHNQLGIVYRHQGRFKEAEAAYMRAVEIDPDYANAYLYLQQPQRALESFERYLSLTSAPDEKVGNWVKELKVRLESAQRGSGAGS